MVVVQKALRRRFTFIVALLAVIAGGIVGAAVRATAQPSQSLAPSALAAPPRALAPAAVATNATCGETITASLTLNGDLTCTAAGLYVSGKSVVLNLGGHTISGGATWPGVDLTGTSDTVENGSIQGFYYGVETEVTSSTDVVSAITETGAHGYGMLLEGGGVKVTNSIAAFAQSDGIATGVGGDTFTGDQELNNGGSGLFTGNGATITSNIANGNHDRGIWADSTAVLTNNIANYNALDGILASTPNIKSKGNTAKGNGYPTPTSTGADQCIGVACN
jgi:hypothetical protein